MSNIYGETCNFCGRYVLFTTMRKHYEDHQDFMQQRLSLSAVIEKSLKQVRAITNETSK